MQVCAVLSHKDERGKIANLLDVMGTGVGCKMVVGPFGRVGVLRDGSRGKGNPVGIRGPMVPIELIDVMEVVMGMGARMGTVGMMDRFGMDPIPGSETQQSHQAQNQGKCIEGPGKKNVFAYFIKINVRRIGQDIHSYFLLFTVIKQRGYKQRRNHSCQGRDPGQSQQDRFDLG